MLKVGWWSGFTDMEREMALEDEARRIAGGDPLMGEIVPWTPPTGSVEGGYESQHVPEACDDCGRVGCTGDVVEGGAETKGPDPELCDICGLRECKVVVGGGVGPTFQYPTAWTTCDGGTVFYGESRDTAWYPVGNPKYKPI